MIDVIASLLPFVKDTTRLHLTFEKISGGLDYLYKIEAEGTIAPIVLDQEEELEEPVETFLNGDPR